MSLVEQAKALLARRRIDSAARELFATPQGRIVFADLLRRTGVLSVSFVPGDAGYGTTFNAGRQSIGQEYLELMRWSEMETAKLSERRTADVLEVLGEE